MIGVYKISNLIDNRVYIGSSKNIESRHTKHLEDLRKNQHHSIHLQRFVNKHGIDKLLFETIDICNEDNLLEIETMRVKQYNSIKRGFNCYMPDRTYYSLEVKRNIALARINCKYNKIIKVIKDNTLIHEGNINSIVEKFNVDKSSVYKILKGKRKTHKNLTFIL